MAHWSTLWPSDHAFQQCLWCAKCCKCLWLYSFEIRSWHWHCPYHWYYPTSYRFYIYDLRQAPTTTINFCMTQFRTNISQFLDKFHSIELMFTVWYLSYNRVVRLVVYTIISIYQHLFIVRCSIMFCIMHARQFGDTVHNGDGQIDGKVGHIIVGVMRTQQKAVSALKISGFFSQRNKQKECTSGSVERPKTFLSV